MAQWNPALLNRLLAPGIAEFSICEIPDFRETHKESQHWLANHFLNNVFHGEFSANNRQFAVNLIFRAQACFSLYHGARDSTMQFIAESAKHNPKTKLYFAAIANWEACFLNHQIFIDVLSKMIGNNIFEPNDNSPEQRAYEMANTIKHWGGAIKRNEHHVNDTIPMWLNNDGFSTRDYNVSYVEFGELVNDMAKVANDLQDPTALAKKNAKT